MIRQRLRDGEFRASLSRDEESRDLDGCTTPARGALCTADVELPYLSRSQLAPNAAAAWRMRASMSPQLIHDGVRVKVTASVRVISSHA